MIKDFTGKVVEDINMGHWNDFFPDIEQARYYSTEANGGYIIDNKQNIVIKAGCRIAFDTDSRHVLNAEERDGTFEMYLGNSNECFFDIHFETTYDFDHHIQLDN